MTQLTILSILPFTGSTRHRQITVVLMLVGIVSYIILIGLLVQWKNIRTRNQTPTQLTSTMCIQQSDVPVIDRHDTDVAVPTDINVIIINNETNYCGDADQVLKWLSEKSLQSMYDDENHPEYKFYHEVFPNTCKRTSKTETVVKLNDLDMKHAVYQQSKTSDSVVKLFWKMGYTRGDIEYQSDEGCIVIKNTGLYFVSTQIMMEIRETFKQLTHYLYKRHKDGSIEKLMENRKQHCDPVTTSSTNLTSSFGAAFIFNKSDRVFVATSSPELLIPGPTTNNFIVYAVYR